MTIESKRKFIINVLFAALIVGILYLIFKYVLIWLMPFVIGLLCAIVLQKPVAWLTTKTKIPRGVWSGILVVVILSAAFSLIAFGVYQLYLQTADFIKNINLPSLVASVNQLSAWFSGWLETLPQDISLAIQSLPGEVLTKIVSLLSGLVSSAASLVVSSGPGLILSVVITIIACCFITADYNKITHFILRQFSDAHQQIILKSKNLFTENILKMLRGYLIILTITFLELLIGLSLLQIDYAVVIAFFIALMDILPVVGTGTAMIPWALYQMVTGNVIMGILLLVVYAFITVVRNIIEPKIIGKQVGLPAIVTLLSMYLGLQLFGFIGLFAFPVTLIILKNLQDAGMIHIWK